MLQADVEPNRHRSLLRPDLVLLALVLGGMLFAAALTYKHDFVFVCRASFPAPLCAALSGAVPRVLAVIGVLCMASMIRPDALHATLRAMRPVLDWRGLGVLAAGCAMIFAPWVLHHVASPDGVAPAAYLALWLGGMALAGVGLLGALFTSDTLRAAARPTVLPVAGLVAFGLVLPEIALAFQPVWRMPWLADLTFETVLILLGALGQSVISDAPTKMIGIDDFGVLVGPQCSGVEGLALITVFLSTYIFLFRDKLHLGRALLLFPIGLLASWTLNTVRIAVLLLIGRYVSPDLAVEGFHSHAGWLMFMALSVGLAVGAHQVRWLQRDGVATAARPRRDGHTPFFRDPVTLLILPFAVFMASSTFTAALSETPALLYPVRMAAVALLLGLGWSVLRALPWRLDPLAVATGAACGVLWIVTAPAASAGDALLAARLAELPALLLAGWVAVRLLGTSLIVPLVEELFFRGYILARLDRGGLAWRLVALAVSTALFAAMHDRQIAGALAGLLFGLLYLRRGNLTDAILSHAAANAVIAGWALTQGDFSVI
ncbi:exosortase E/protease, VPEID-CTERM system [Meridianimarinicoccus roseus]|uniref:Exosortase E/protease, VPEID-CTERM system n=1 Tax=Meridianimarinicoccus roseus TaxID=2072018 RepID=A0A2V2LF76_9RHOB|nr:exosortase E/protease, VPEID-CTERM system [Meridianimarinicoccus roseus]PWR02541.1 exosortase E/protease, VPEID-CTERM system [Meridianimarinicoccus roseus]